MAHLKSRSCIIDIDGILLSCFSSELPSVQKKNVPPAFACPFFFSAPCCQRMRTFRIALLGDRLVGKSSWVNRIQRGEFTCAPFCGAPLIMETTCGPISFDFRELQTLMFDVDVDDFDAVIIMSDPTKRSFDNMTQRCLPEVCKYLPGLPVFFMTNKATGVDTAQTTIGCFHHFYVNAKTCSNLEAPLVAIARHLTGSNDLEFAEMPPIPPPVVRLEINQDIAKRLIELLGGLFAGK